MTKEARRPNLQAPVVQKVGIAIRWINLYPISNEIGFPNTYPLDSDYPVDSGIQRLNNRGLVVTLTHAQHECTVEPRYNDPRHNDIPGITINMLCPGKSYSTVKCMEQNPDLTIPRYNDLIPLLPWQIVISGFHCSQHSFGFPSGPIQFFARV